MMESVRLGKTSQILVKGFSHNVEVVLQTHLEYLETVMETPCSHLNSSGSGTLCHLTTSPACEVIALCLDGGEDGSFLTRNQREKYNHS